MSKHLRVLAPLFAVVLAASITIVAVAGSASALSPPYTTTTHVKSNHPAALLTGQAATFTAAVITPGTSSVATGQVTFTITGSDASTVTCDGGTNTFTLTPGTPAAGSTAVCSLAGGLLASGNQFTIAVAYTGDGTHLASNGSLTQTVTQGTTKTTVTSSSNPSVTGQPVTFTASVAVTGLAVGNPTGTVTFALTGVGDGSTIDCDGGDVVTVASQSAQCTVSAGFLAQSSPIHVVATYSGDGNFKTSTVAFMQTVQKDATTIVVTPSMNPVVTGQPVSFTAVVTPNPVGGGTITGSVTFTITDVFGPAPHCDGGNTVVLVSDSATCSFAAGLTSKAISYTVTAALTDPNFSGPAGSVTETVNEGATDLSFAISPATVHAGETFTITATVTPVAPAVGIPTGIVDFSICQPNTTGLCVGGPINMTAAKNGVAVWTVAGGQFPGATLITVSYLGDSNFEVSATNRTIPIGLEGVQVNVTSSKNPSVSGQQVRLTAAVLSQGGNSTLVGPPTGDVNFTITGASGDAVDCVGGVTDIGLNNTNDTQAIAICVIPSNTLVSTDSPYHVTAAYSGDFDYNPATGALPSQLVR